MALDTETLALVRAHEPDRYLAALAAPAEVRDDLLALAAFAAEVRRVPKLARDPLVGEIRLTWWREAIEALANGARTGNPIADALAPALARGAFSAPRLTGFLDALAFDLSPVAFVDAEARAIYLGKTEGALFRLGLARLGLGDPPDALIGLASRAYGLARAALDLQGPAPLVTAADLAATGTRLADLSLPEGEQAREAIAGRFRAEISETQTVLRPQLAAVAAEHRPALLPLVMASSYAGWAIRGSTPSSAPLRRVWRIWRAHRTGRLGD